MLKFLTIQQVIIIQETRHLLHFLGINPFLLNKGDAFMSRAIVLFASLVVFASLNPIFASVSSDFSVELQFIPDDNPQQGQTRSFAGASDAQDGLDERDVLGAAPSGNYYVYFDIGVPATYLLTDTRHWSDPATRQ